MALASENASGGFFLTGTTTSYGFGAVKGDVFGMVLDSSGNYANCHVSAMSLVTAPGGVAGTAAGLTPGIATFKSVTAGTLAGYALPVGTATVASLNICPPIAAAAADGESVSANAACADEASGSAEARSDSPNLETQDPSH